MSRGSFLTKIARKYSIYFWSSLVITTIVVITRPDTAAVIRFQALIFLTIAYLCWALIFHIIDKSINLEIVIEYLLTATLTLVILYSLLI